VASLPEPLQASYQILLCDKLQSESHHQIIKAADTLSAYLKCLAELKVGNNEFKVTAQELERKLKASTLPEVGYFMETFIPNYQVPLDDIIRRSTQKSCTESVAA